ncbi:MAG: hypothetical protein WBR18_09330 [Anaerolineales bacterium]
MIPGRHHLIPLLLVGLLSACSPLTPSATPSPTARPTRTEVVKVSPTATIRPTPVTPTPIPIPADMLRQMRQIESQVESLRGLTRSGPIKRRLLPASVMREIISDGVASAYPPEQAGDDGRTLALFGLVPADFDLELFYEDLYREQTVGFYDPTDGIMYAIDGTGFRAPQRLNYAHEFVNLLQDQNWAAAGDPGFGSSGCDRSQDSCRAERALLEGDAGLVEEQWLRTFASAEQVNDLFSYYQTFDSPVFDGAPTALQERLLFPFEQGLEFVRWLERNGGWAAVDAAYEDPPRSSEQILHPYLYPADQPAEFAPLDIKPSVLGAGWRQLDQGTLGEFALVQVLAQSVDREVASQAAEGWGGDVYQAFFDDNRGVGAWIAVQSWDTIRDSQDALLTWRQYGDERFGPHEMNEADYVWESEAGSARLARESNQTLWIQTPSLATAELLRSAVHFPAAKK